jgi:hypothetical protein
MHSPSSLPGAASHQPSTILRVMKNCVRQKWLNLNAGRKRQNSARCGNLQNGIIPHGVCGSARVGRSYLDSSWPIKKAER